MPARSPAKAKGSRTVDEWVVEAKRPAESDEDESGPTTPKKRRGPTGSALPPTPPPTTPSRSSRSQGLGLNRIQHKAFCRSTPTGEEAVFSLGDHVVVGPSAAPSGRAWLHNVKSARNAQTQRQTLARLRRIRAVEERVDRGRVSESEGEDDSSESEEEDWQHEDGLGKNEKVAVIIGLWEDERGDKNARVRWFARPSMMWGDAGPPSWAQPDDWPPYEVCYVQDSEWYASKKALAAVLARGKKFNETDLTASEYALCAKSVTTATHAEDDVKVSDITERVSVRSWDNWPAVEADDEVSAQPKDEDGRRLFRCRRIYDSRPQAWDRYGFVRSFPAATGPSNMPKTKSPKKAAHLADLLSFQDTLARGLKTGHYDLPVEERDIEAEEKREEERRAKRRLVLKARNAKKMQEEREKAQRRSAAGHTSADEEEVIVRRTKTDDFDDDESSSAAEEDDEDDFDATQGESTESEEEDMSDDSDFDGHRGPGGPTTPSKKSPGKSKKRRSPTKLKVKETAADRAKKASIQARKQARLAAGLSARPGARLPTVSSYVDDPALLDPFARARAVLHVSATPEELPCRDDEAATIGAYLEEAIEEGSGSCLYIAGVPGTGKTATVHNLIRGLKQQARRGEISPFKFLEINGMKVTEPNQTYVQLWEFLSGGERTSPRQALSSLNDYFNNPSANRNTCVVLVDELDQLIVKNTKNEVIYNFFNWPTQAHSKLIVLAIANKMDMPESDLSAKINSRLGSNRLTFQSYKKEALQTIITSRLTAVPGVFSSEAIRYVATRVGGVTGDCRKALDVCRRTVEVVEAENAVRKAKGQPAELIKPGDCDRVYRSMIGSGRATVLANLSIHQQTMLVAISKVVQSLGVAEVEMGDVIKRHALLCSNSLGIAVPTHDELFGVLASLQPYGFVEAKESSLDYFAPVKTLVKDEELRLVIDDGRFAQVLNTGT